MEFLVSLFQKLDLYILIFGRISGFFLTAVPFSSRNIPVQVKVGFASLIAFLIFTVLLPEKVVISGEVFGFFLQFLSEVLIGFIIGFLTQLVFGALQLAGQIIDMQIGFGIVNVIDPQFGIQIPVLGNFKYILALLFFLTINGHHLFLEGLVRSYEVIPLGTINISGSVYQYLFQLAGGMFATALKVSLPVVAALFIADLALGIVARTVPQMNVFIVGFPLKIGAGLVLLMVVLPLYIWVFGVLFERLFEDLEKLLLLLGR
jgi:flagellar biosynthetic protein FliR